MMMINIFVLFTLDLSDKLSVLNKIKYTYYVLKAILAHKNTPFDMQQRKTKTKLHNTINAFQTLSHLKCDVCATKDLLLRLF